MEEIRVFSPATVANVACGFDILGFALEAPGDETVVRRVGRPGIHIRKIEGIEGLPMEATQNVAGVSLQAMVDALGLEGGFELELYKGVKPGSGIGSSAASAAGSVFAANELLGQPCTRAELVAFAMEGEKLVSGVAHADNVAPGLMGGFVLVRSYSPLDLVSIPAPDALHCTVIHPKIELRTSDARNILRKEIPLSAAITQWGNVAGLIAGLFQGDLELVGRSLEDVVIEPVRSILIPAYDAVKVASLEAGALGCSISGSGPSIFALSDAGDKAEAIAEAMRKTYTQVGVPFDIYTSKVNTQGCRVV